MPGNFPVALGRALPENGPMLTADFDYLLPPELIAQEPAQVRTGSRLMSFRRRDGEVETGGFEDLANYLRPGDLLVMNRSRVIPARLSGRRKGGTGRIEVLLLEPAGGGGWWAMLRPGKRIRVGETLELGETGEVLRAWVREKNDEGHGRLEFEADPVGFAERNGRMPLPPYIKREEPGERDRERYQTVYAREPGSVAAPTAGLHFTREFLDHLAARGIERAELTLHVGVGTFAPVKAERVEEHVMHSERFAVDASAVESIQRARAEGRRIVAVGTTSLRVLESVAAANGGRLVAGHGRTAIFLHPPADFQVVGALLTNFHLPRSTLLMLVSAFAEPGGVTGRERVLAAYREAVARRFRFFSYGDAMFLH